MSSKNRTRVLRRQAVFYSAGFGTDVTVEKVLATGRGHIKMCYFTTLGLKMFIFNHSEGLYILFCFKSFYLFIFSLSLPPSLCLVLAEVGSAHDLLHS